MGWHMCFAASINFLNLQCKIFQFTFFWQYSRSPLQYICYGPTRTYDPFPKYLRECWRLSNGKIQNCFGLNEADLKERAHSVIIYDHNKDQKSSNPWIRNSHKSCHGLIKPQYQFGKVWIPGCFFLICFLSLKLYFNVDVNNIWKKYNVEE